MGNEEETERIKKERKKGRATKNIGRKPLSKRERE